MKRIVLAAMATLCLCATASAEQKQYCGDGPASKEMAAIKAFVHRMGSEHHISGYLAKRLGFGEQETRIKIVLFPISNGTISAAYVLDTKQNCFFLSLGVNAKDPTDRFLWSTDRNGTLLHSVEVIGIAGEIVPNETHLEQFTAVKKVLIETAQQK